jgi:ABC-2 type transport system permease protein
VNRVAAPGFFRHLWLLWGLRLDIGLNQGAGRSPFMAVAAFLLSSAPAWGLGVTFYGLMRLKPIAENGVWPFFILNLLCFVTSAVWVTWPLMSAGVDDHSELSRYAPFPISPFRLLIASTVASLFEPRALVFYAPLTGAALGFASVHPVRLKWFAVLLYVLFALLNAAWSRVALHSVLNVLREKHSAQLIGGGFVLFLVAASLIPPIDTSWLTAVGEGGVEKLDMAIIIDATIALGRVPSGFFGDALLELSYGYRRNALVDGVGMVFFALLGLGLAYALLLRFHRNVGRAGPSEKESGDNDPFARTRTTYTTLLAREALDLWRNPRARLLASVPFVLAILLKVTSGRALFEYLLGASADAWLMGGLCIYGAVVMASTFSQNTFAYDGHGLAMLIAAPVELGDVLRAKNVVQGTAAGAMGLLVGLFYRVYFGKGSALDFLCAMTAVVAVVPVLLAAGNFLSLYFPVKFHASLKRRDKLPLTASMLGIVAASVGCAPFVWALRFAGKSGPSGQTLAMIALCAAFNVILYRSLLPLALRLLGQRREIVLRAVTRE